MVTKTNRPEMTPIEAPSNSASSSTRVRPAGWVVGDDQDRRPPFIDPASRWTVPAAAGADVSTPAISRMSGHGQLVTYSGDSAEANQHPSVS
jgi:hypothetical protein